MQYREVEKKHLNLARKWLAGTISTEEKEDFSRWYAENQDEQINVPHRNAVDDDAYGARLLFNIRKEIRNETASRRLLWFRPAIAASVLVILASAGLIYYFNQKGKAQQAIPIAVQADVLPGGDKATLTLGDGSVLKLDQLADGAVKAERGLTIRKSNGELIYEVDGYENSRLTYNVIRTPRGGQFRVILPDGSKVWLNASSSLQYPTSFKGVERLVKLTGEGYFEVAKNKSKGKFVPFRINVNDREVVEVLGTHFNIMAYSDEKNIKTTLLEGQVKVIKPGTTTSGILNPGQQAIYSVKTGFQIKSNIDGSEAISWKNGLISFKDADVQEIMRQIERWYDVKVVYKGAVSRRSFTGGIARNSRLSSVLEVLELNDIHFEVKDREITVLP